MYLDFKIHKSNLTFIQYNFAITQSTENDFEIRDKFYYTLSINVSS